MQKGDKVTWCADFSSSLPSSTPMKNLPPAICAMSLRQVGDGEGTTGALTDTDGAAATARSFENARDRTAKNPIAAAMTTAIPPKNHPLERTKLDGDVAGVRNASADASMLE